MSQCERILQYLDDFGSISAAQAMSDLGVYRLASRIHDLKRMGVNIQSETMTGKNRYGEATHFSVYRRV